MSGAGGSPAVQVLVRATRVPGATAPYDTAHVKVYYPALTETCDPIGTLAPDRAAAPMPLFVWFTGNSTDPAVYSWLAERVARAGFCFVTFTHIGLIPPDVYGITPGADLAVARPETFGSAPMAALLEPVLQVVAGLDESGPLQGLLDLDALAIGGHSAGGTVVLNSAAHRFFPSLRGVVSYAAHTMASTMFGWQAGTVLPLTGDVPVLMFSAGQDGLVAKGARWYGEEGRRYDPVGRTFDTLPAGPVREASRLVEIGGANHFSVCAPRGESLPRLRDDSPATVDEEAVRDLIGDLTVAFLRGVLRGDTTALGEIDRLMAASDLVDG